MKQNILLVIVLVIALSCKKERVSQIRSSDSEISIKKEDFTPTEYFSIPTDFKVWKHYKEKAVDDSIKEITGEFGNYKIVGFLNNRMHKKYWWLIVNKNIKNDSVSIQYSRYNNKEYVNQFIYYDKGKKDLKNSQFYEKENLKDSNTVRFKFYSNFSKKNSSAKLLLYFFDDEIKIKDTVIKCKNTDDYFYADLKYNTKESYILKGLYEESATKGSKHFTDIFILDSIR